MQMCVYVECIYMHTCVCACVLERVSVCVHLSWQGWKLSACWAGWAEWPESQGSLIMPDRSIRGESCFVPIATDKESMSPLNLSIHTGRKRVQTGRGGKSWAWRVNRGL